MLASNGKDPSGRPDESIRERRQRLNLTQQQIAVGANCSVAMASLIDRGLVSERSEVAARIEDFLNRYERTIDSIGAGPSSDLELADLLKSLPPESLARFASGAARLARDDRLDADHQTIAALLAGIATRLAVNGDDPAVVLAEIAPDGFFEATVNGDVASQTGRPEPDPVLDRAAAGSSSFQTGGGHGQRQGDERQNDGLPETP